MIDPMPAPVPTPLPPRILLYDGVCGLCSRFVQVMIDLDRQGRFAYAPLQGETTAVLRAAHPEIPDHLDTIVYVRDGHAFVYSDAILEAARELPFPWRLGRLFLWVPRVVRDGVYRAIARRRYAIWGQTDSCRIPRPDEIERFLP